MRRSHPLFSAVHFSVAALLLSGLTPTASGDLKRTGDLSAFCGGNQFKGREEAATLTDPAGNKFILDCVDRTYFEGTVVRADGTRYQFGKCVFDEGLNDQSFLVDEKNMFARIAWANVKPAPGITLEDVKEKENESIDDYKKRIEKLVKDHKSDLRFYDTSFSPGDQFITSFTGGDFDAFVTLAAAEAEIAYGEGGLSILQIDPAMREPPYDYQPNSGQVHMIPEPGFLGGLGLGLVGLLHCASLRRHPA